MVIIARGFNMKILNQFKYYDGINLVAASSSALKPHADVVMPMPPDGDVDWGADLIKRILALLLGLWLGAQLTVGYVVAPVLFAQLPKMTAGHIAGILFAYLSYFGLLVWAWVAYVGRLKQERSFLKSHTLKWIALLWALVAVNQWLVTPVIHALKTEGANWLLTLAGGSFAVWHGVSSSLFLVVSLIGLVLVWRLLRFEWH